MKDFLRILADNGWIVSPAETARPITNERLKKAPDGFREFVAQFDALTREDDKVWFLSLKDYETEAGEEAFAWNEFEKECLEYAEDDDEREEIAAFWENTLPIAMSVDGDYAYLGLVLGGDDCGRVVYGCGPIYEETEIVCDSFAELLELFAHHAAGDGGDDSPLNDFV